MTSEQISESIRLKKLRLPRGQKLNHFLIVVILTVPSLTLLVFYFKDLVETGAARTGFLWAGLLLIAPAALFFYIQDRRLRMHAVETDLSHEQIIETVEMVARRLGWQRSSKTDRSYIASTSPGFWSGSWGELITILFDKNTVLINSICDPDQQSSVVSCGRNRKNVEALVIALKRREFGGAPKDQAAHGTSK
jgi:hypothetical protein